MPFLEIDGGRLFYEEQGEGNPPLVFVHGLACAQVDWDHQLGRFRATHHTVSHDQRGHGRSVDCESGFDIEHFGADVAALMAHLELPPAVLIGHSMGCRVVLECARIAPARVAGLVLIDGSRLASADPQAARTRLLGGVEDRGYEAFIDGFFSQMFTDSSDAATREAIVARARRLPKSVILELLSSGVFWDCDVVQPALECVKVPMTVIQSTYLNEHRQRVSLEPGESTPWLELVTALVPHARIEILPGIGHFAMLEAPDEVNRHIESLLDRLACK